MVLKILYFHILTTAAFWLVCLIFTISVHYITLHAYLWKAYNSCNKIKYILYDKVIQILSTGIGSKLIKVLIN
jgi:hypothetical protein